MKVAILGAGFSGMLAAYLLDKEGIEVTVYEKEDHIGGHCKTLVSNEEYTELGTVFSFSKQIKELLIAFQLEVTFSKEQILEAYGNQIYFGPDGVDFDGLKVNLSNTADQLFIYVK